MPSQPAGDKRALKKLGRYELLELLGRGGMAEVYKARLPGALGFDKMVAVKRILPEARQNQEYVDMFVREARLCSRMMHPNLIQVFEFAETEGELFLAMELVEGSDLRKVITAHKQLGKPVPAEFTALLAIGVLRGLDGAHRLTDEKGQPLNVVHRDLSPANVLLSYEGAIKVADFGVAHQGERSDADGNSIKGKLQYMAPEQLLTGEVDARVDVFAAGCVLYELLTGAPVYPFGQTPEVIQRVAKGLYTPVEQLAPDTPQELAAIVRRSLEADRDRRYSDCATFANELARLVQRGVLPSATSEDFGLYLQVLLPKQPFRAELAHTPSAEDQVVPILAGSLSVPDEPFPELLAPQPVLISPEPMGMTPPPMSRGPITGPVLEDVTAVSKARLVSGQLPRTTPTPPQGFRAASPPPQASRPATRPPPPPPQASAAPTSELDNMLRAYLEDSETAGKPEAPKVEVEEKKKWFKWRK